MLKKIWTPKINFFFCLLYLEVVSFSVTTICRKLMRIFSDSCFESLPVSTLACVGPSVAIHYAQWLSFFPPRILPAIWCLFFPPFIEWWREIKSLRLCLNKTFQKTVACHGSVRVHTPTYCCSFLHFPSQKGEKNKTKKDEARLQTVESFWHGWFLQHCLGIVWESVSCHGPKLWQGAS